VYDLQGRDLRSLKWIDGHELARRGIHLYHYSLVFPKQVVEKSEYYGSLTWARHAKAREWAQEAFLELRRPYRVHNVYRLPSWLQRFEGSHPPQIEDMFRNIEEGLLEVELRQTDDVERLLESRRYQVGRAVLRLLDPLVQILLARWRRWRRRLP
jgi:hypothetical protein